MTPTALIIDHSPISSQLIARLLERGGFHVVGTSHDGLLGLRLAAEHRPSLITLDLVLPSLTGLQMAAAIRRSAPDVAMMVISAINARTRVDAASKLGIDYYILKPISQERLVEVACLLRADLETRAA